MHGAYLAHHGIKGQRWGVRRFQNEDGSLTPAGEKHRERLEIKESKKKAKQYEKSINDQQHKVRELTGLGIDYAFERENAKAKAKQYKNASNFAKTDKKREKYIRKAQEFTR